MATNHTVRYRILKGTPTVRYKDSFYLLKGALGLRLDSFFLLKGALGLRLDSLFLLKGASMKDLFRVEPCRRFTRSCSQFGLFDERKDPIIIWQKNIHCIIHPVYGTIVLASSSASDEHETK